MLSRRKNSRGRSALRVSAAALMGLATLVVASPPAHAAVVATFSSAGVLAVFGDGVDNTIVISRNAAGALLVNGGAVPIGGGTATVANTALIQVFGQAGNDKISLSETSGALPRANLFGGTGDDTLTGGSGTDQLFGSQGSDVVLGKGGTDFVFGGSESDRLTGGDGDDQVFGESGDDRMIWNPGDDTDLNEGGAGTDRVQVNGGNGAEVFSAIENGSRVRFDRVQPAPFALDIGTTEQLVLAAAGGDDRFSAAGNLAGRIAITVDAGAGNDTILGSNGPDVIRGGGGSDVVDGQQGADVVSLGAGADRFTWDPGDGSDTIEGQQGTDEVEFNGSAAAELFAASANGGRLLFTRNIAVIAMDIDDVEVLDVRALGGTDTLTVNDLTGTDVVEVQANLAATLGGTVGDRQADNVIVNGTSGDDIVELTGSGGSTSVTGLRARVQVTSGESDLDRLTVNGLAGDDVVDGSRLPAGTIQFAADGGDGSDVLLGGAGPDTLIGGLGDDVLIGGPGVDTLDGGPGDNFVVQG